MSRHAFISTIAAEKAEAFEIIAGPADAPALVLCDHASAYIPPEFNALSLNAAERARHIAYDIGAEEISRQLAHLLHAPLVMSHFSRLLIDPNRGKDDPTLIRQISDGALVEGNLNLTEAAHQERITRFYIPYDDAIARTLRAMLATNSQPMLLSIHSFTPEMCGFQRPWHIGLAYGADARLAKLLLQALEAEGDLCVGDQDPYQGDLRGATLDRHAVPQQLPHILIEIRQDLISDLEGCTAWAARLARLISPLFGTI